MSKFQQQKYVTQIRMTAPFFVVTYHPTGGSLCLPYPGSGSRGIVGNSPASPPNGVPQAQAFPPPAALQAPEATASEPEMLGKDGILVEYASSLSYGGVPTMGVP